MNHLYYGDNLNVLRNHIATESVDLIYLDPPFNSKRDYNLLFKSPKGQTSEAQIEAFLDTWHWNEQAEREFDEILHQPNTDVAEMMRALHSFLGVNDMMAYLTMMANRLLELHRVLKPTGSLYLHCDPTASHYLKILLDGVFGKLNYRNEIVWKRTSGRSSGKQLGRIHDTIFFYTRGEKSTFLPPTTKQTLENIKGHDIVHEGDAHFRLSDLSGGGQGPARIFDGKEISPPKNRHWMFDQDGIDRLWSAGSIILNSKGIPRWKKPVETLKEMDIGDLWIDIEPINSAAIERMHYPTQKPLALLERIIESSSNQGDLILDPFCGCGTAVDAAQNLKRRWIGIDITHLAISLIEKRLNDRYDEKCKFEVHGTPKDIDAARDLARRDKYQFQWWAISLVNAQPFQGKKKGADGGMDGIKYFHDVDKAGARKIVVSVKSGGLKADDLRALNHVRDREKAEIALFISLDEPTKGMEADAASAGFYTSASGKKFPRIQLLTIEGLLSGKHRAEHPDHQPDLNFKKAKAVADADQTEML
jgi:site-specific DNA-methyltransferase (adenine-specific)